MTRQASLLALACLFVTAQTPAQQTIPPLNDPANLAGERVSPPALADDLPVNHGAAALQQLLLKLRTRASMMMIVAHPDDEDGGLLTYESRGQGARVAMLTLTRGEGGQNLMSADFNDALGLIRTQELLAADRHLGVDQMFGTEVDFGFSKTKEETLKQWGYDRVLYDAVRAVRLYRPLVLASVFVGGPTDGHGHHQVAGEITQLVFKAAGDPNVFPEMIKDGLLPWTPLKVYARTPFARITAEGMFDYATGKFSPPRFHNYVTGVDINAEPKATVMINEGAPAMVDGKPALGMDGLSYVQFARKGLALQKTQIGTGERRAPAGRVDVGYTLMGSHIKQEASSKDLSSFAAGGGSASRTSPGSGSESSVFEGIDTSLPAIADLAPDAPAKLRADLGLIDSKIAEAQKQFDPARLEASAGPLREALQTLDTLIAGSASSALPSAQKYNLLHELRIKRVQLNNALVLSLGVSVASIPEVRANSVNGPIPNVPDFRLELVPGGLLHLQANLSKPVESVRVEARRGSDSLVLTPSPDKMVFSGTFVVSSQLAPTRPYFSRPDLEQPYYTVSDPALRNAPVTPTPIQVKVTFRSEGVPLEVDSTPSVPVSTELIGVFPPEPIVIAPALDVDSDRLKIVPLDQPAGPGRIVFGAMVSANVDTIEGSLAAHLPSGWQASVKRGGGVAGGVAGVALAKPVRIQVGGAAPKSVRSEEPEPTRTAQPKTDFRLNSDNAGHAQFNFDLAPGSLQPNAAYPISLSATANGHTFEGQYRRIGYDGLTHTIQFIPAQVRVVSIDVKTASDLRIAYVPGTGDDVPEYLRSLGVFTTFLGPGDVTAEKLAKFDAVILGVRAYAAHPELAGAGSKPLNDFAAGGGVVIVQYNTASDATGTAPYPFRLPGDQAHNVVEEQWPVKVIAPEAPLLNWPNKITAADFDHWVEERGHGFASTWAPEYQPLLEMHDPGQDPQEGGLLVAKVGKGAYIYCALALYRQLPEGVPGAYRLTANLLSYAKNPSR